MKKVEIIVGGTGHEITRSNFTCEELKKVREYCEENDEDMESVLTNDLEEVLEDRGQWYDCDDLGHFMGGNLSCKLYVTVDDDEYEFETNDTQIQTNKLKLVVNQIETTDSVFDLIQEMWYGGLQLIGDGFSDTTGKAFDVEIDECDEDE